MDWSGKRDRNHLSILWLIFVILTTLFFHITHLFAQNPNSGTTSTGQTLTVNILTPEDGSVFPGPPPCVVDVTGVATLDGEEVSILYVVDLSGSTSNPNTVPPIDINNDGNFENDDYNGDGQSGFIIDAEIAAVIALNESVGDFNIVETGIIGYATNAANADVGPEADVQFFTPSPLFDGQPDDVSDIEEVLRSMTSDPAFGGGGRIGKFTVIPKSQLGSQTNYEAALQQIILAFSDRPERSRIVFFLSDGISDAGDTIDDELAQLESLGIIINTIEIVNSQSASADLQRIANRTGGGFTRVDDLTQLDDILPVLPVAGIDTVTVNNVGADLSPAGTFKATINLEQGINTIAATALATDETEVTATISATCGTVPPEPVCSVVIDSPLDGEVLLDSMVIVEFTLTYLPGFTSNISAKCTVNGVEATEISSTDTTKTATAIVPCQPGENRIKVSCDIIDTVKSQLLAQCDTSITVLCVAPLECKVEIDSPQDGAFICSDSVVVTGNVAVSGGIAPVVEHCEVNGVNAALTSDGKFRATVACPPGEEIDIVAVCFVVDTELQLTTGCSDTVKVKCVAPLVCDLQITSPSEGDAISTSNVTVKGSVTISGGALPHIKECDVNGVAAIVNADGSFEAEVPCPPGKELELVASCTIVDSCGFEVVCRDTVTVKCISPPECFVSIESPADGAVICTDSVTVTAAVDLLGGFELVLEKCDVNGVPATLDAGKISATILCPPGDTLQIIATCVAIDRQLNREVTCSDTIEVICAAPPVCAVQITSPAEGAVITNDIVTVMGITTIEGGTSPVIVKCEVNGVEADIKSNNSFEVRVPCPEGADLTLVATCTIIDSCGFEVVCRDTVTVSCASDSLFCAVEITSPEDRALFCSNSVVVEGVTTISGGISPTSIKECDVNGVAATILPGNMFTVEVPLPKLNNFLIATCTVVDSSGQEAVCRDTIKVVRDKRPPTCEFEFDENGISGRFKDRHSGIASIVPVEIRNGTLTVESFSPGDHEVEFRIDIVNKNKNIFFSIDVFDVCGNQFNCDPVYLSLNSDSNTRQFSFTFPSVDRYFELTNNGLSEVRVSLNGHKFSIFSDAGRASSELNAYPVPPVGKVTLDLSPYLKSSGENDMFVAFEGAPGTRGQIMIAGEVGQVDYTLDLRHIPEKFHLAQNYPNPFNPTTNIVFDVPDDMADGVLVKLTIYNLLGESVRELVNEQKFPGRYTVAWNGRDHGGRTVSSGIYIYQLTAGDLKQTRRMLLLK